MSKSPSPRPLTSRELLERIGCNSLDSDSVGFAGFHADLEEDATAALIERYQALERRSPLNPGTVVRWKPGLKNRRWPHYGQPAIVLEVLQSPILDHREEMGSAYFREPLDVVLGLLIDDPEVRGDLFTFHYDSRRFEPWTATNSPAQS